MVASDQPIIEQLNAIAALDRYGVRNATFNEYTHMSSGITLYTTTFEVHYTAKGANRNDVAKRVEMLRDSGTMVLIPRHGHIEVVEPKYEPSE